MNRPSPGESKRLIPLIEAMRYSGAVMVMLFHVMFFPSGYKGVDLFFVISGFVLYHRYMMGAGQGESTLLYFVRRTSKIYLLYWTAVCAYLLTFPIPITGDFWKTLLLWPSHRSIVGISWSLSYELYFYAFFGLLLFIKQPHIRRSLAVLVLVTSTIVTVVNTATLSLKGSLLNFLVGHNTWEFMLGLAAGYLMEKHPIRSRRWSYLLLLAGFATLCYLSLPFKDVASSSIYGFCSFAAVYGAACISHTGYRDVSKIVAMLGRSSYAIYLFHPLLMLALSRIGITNLFAQVLLVTVLSILMNRFYEEPLLRAIRRGRIYSKAVTPIPRSR